MLSETRMFNTNFSAFITFSCLLVGLAAQAADPQVYDHGKALEIQKLQETIEAGIQELKNSALPKPFGEARPEFTTQHDEGIVYIIRAYEALKTLAVEWRNDLKQAQEVNSSPRSWWFQKKDYVSLRSYFFDKDYDSFQKSILSQELYDPALQAGLISDKKMFFTVTADLPKVIEFVERVSANADTSIKSFWEQAYTKAKADYEKALAAWQLRKDAFDQGEVSRIANAHIDQRIKALQDGLAADIETVNARRDFCDVPPHDKSDQNGLHCHGERNSSDAVGLTWMGYFVANACLSPNQAKDLSKTLEICRYRGPVKVGRCWIMHPYWKDANGKTCEKQWGVVIGNEIVGSGCFEAAEDALKFIKTYEACGPQPKDAEAKKQ